LTSINSDNDNRKRLRVLFLCTHNSARSQMAEGLLRTMHGDRFEAYSAGIAPTYVDPYAIAAMKEIGIDISKQNSKSVCEFRDIIFDLAITVCDRAKQACPIVSTDLGQTGCSPKARQILHHSFPDPAAITGSEEERLLAFRSTRDEICNWITQTLSKPIA